MKDKTGRFVVISLGIICFVLMGIVCMVSCKPSTSNPELTNASTLEEMTLVSKTPEGIKVYTFRTGVYLAVSADGKTFSITAR